jgi:hypothetical protein
MSGNARADALGSNTLYFMLGRMWADLASAALDSRRCSKHAALVQEGGTRLSPENRAGTRIRRVSKDR